MKLFLKETSKLTSNLPFFLTVIYFLEQETYEVNTLEEMLGNLYENALTNIL